MYPLNTYHTMAHKNKRQWALDTKNGSINVVQGSVISKVSKMHEYSDVKSCSRLLPVEIAIVLCLLATLTKSTLIIAITLNSILCKQCKHAIVSTDMFTKAMNHTVTGKNKVYYEEKQSITSKWESWYLHNLRNGFSLGFPRLCKKLITIVCLDPLFVDCSVAHGWNGVCLCVWEEEEEFEKDKGTSY